MNLHVDHIGDLAVVECQGRIFSNEAAFALRDTVMSQGEASAIVLDLSQVYALGDSVLYMLVRLNQWAHDQHVDLHFFNPTSFVCETFDQTGFREEFKIDNTLDQIVALTAQSSRSRVHA